MHKGPKGSCADKCNGKIIYTTFAISCHAEIAKKKIKKEGVRRGKETSSWSLSGVPTGRRFSISVTNAANVWPKSIWYTHMQAAAGPTRHRAFKSDIIEFANEYVNKNAKHTQPGLERSGTKWRLLPPPDDNQLNRRAEMPSPPSRPNWMTDWLTSWLTDWHADQMMRNECEMVISISISISNGNENGGIPIAIALALATENANRNGLSSGREQLAFEWRWKWKCVGPARSDSVDSASKSALSRDQIKVNSFSTAPRSCLEVRRVQVRGCTQCEGINQTYRTMWPCVKFCRPLIADKVWESTRGHPLQTGPSRTWRLELCSEKLLSARWMVLWRGTRGCNSGTRTWSAR